MIMRYSGCQDKTPNLGGLATRNYSVERRVVENKSIRYKGGGRLKTSGQFSFFLTARAYEICLLWGLRLATKVQPEGCVERFLCTISALPSN